MTWLYGDMGEFGQQSFKSTVENQTLIALLSIPIYTAISKITFIGIKKLNLTEHAIIYFYLMGATTVASFPFMVLFLIVGVNYFIISYVFIILVILYTAWCLKRIFDLSIGSILFRTFLFLIFLFVVYVLAVLALLAFAYLTGGIEGIKEMAKPPS